MDPILAAHPIDSSHHGKIHASHLGHGCRSSVLADDNFASIVAAIREGRGIFANALLLKRVKMSESAA